MTNASAKLHLLQDRATHVDATLLALEMAESSLQFEQELGKTIGNAFTATLEAIKEIDQRLTTLTKAVQFLLAEATKNES